MLPNGDFCLEAVGSEAVLVGLYQTATKDIREEATYFVDVDDAYSSARSHMQKAMQTETFPFEGALAIALNDDIGFFKELMKLSTITFDIEIKAALAFAHD